MLVRDIMSRNTIYVSPNETVFYVMCLMRECDLGFIVIAENKNVLGVITDRDIVLSLSINIKYTDKICKIMKRNIVSINEYQHINDASDLLGNMQIKRLIVLNDSSELCGVLSICDIARNILLEDNALEALTEISYDYSTKKDNLISIEIKML